MAATALCAIGALLSMLWAERPTPARTVLFETCIDSLLNARRAPAFTF